jgi:hypothetical protein
MKKEACPTVEEHGVSARRQNTFEFVQELVPLAEAAAVAYHVVTKKPRSLRDPLELEEVRGLVAIALSSVAPVLCFENGKRVPLSAAQIEERLFSRASSRPRSRGGAPDLSGLFMRRGDMIRAIETLKEAHASFGRK